MRKFAWLTPPRHGVTPHYVTDVPLDPANRRLMPPAHLLVITERREGFFLDRFGPDGVRAGDTWHQSLEWAIEQVEYEFGEALSWSDMPEDVDPWVFASAHRP